jgi:tRNA nucleotidyltransferase (CCA-adding enzyme)
VGGALRDAFIGRSSSDWDLATSALPEQTVAVFDDAVYENRFGTVAVRRDGAEYQITTFRSDHDYADHRRPHRVEFGTAIEADLARRDFTMNALAWGGVAGGHTSSLVDPFGGVTDATGGVIRAVGEPGLRFREDALRMIRAVRFAATLGFTIEPATLDAIRAESALVGRLSGERIAVELDKMLGADRPSSGLRLLEETGLLRGISADLAAQTGVVQNKIAGEDLWDHTLRTVDASTNRPVVRLAALLHDIGKPATAADGHFYGHETVGADLAGALLERLHVPRSTSERVILLVRQHMFRYDPSWGDAAVRRFIGKIGPEALDELFALREGDNEGSGVPRDADDLDGLRARVAAEQSAGLIIDRRDLAIDGDDLIAELGLEPGPVLGRIIDDLLDRVVEDRALNDRPTLMLLARDAANRLGAGPAPPSGGR